MLLLALAAHAHSPHDVCPAAARGPDGFILAGELRDLARFHPDGTVAAHLPSPGEAAACIAPLTTESWALVTAEGAAWRSDDAGATWARLPVAGVRACAGGAGGALLAGAEGVWWVPEAGGASSVGGGDFYAVAEASDGAVYALDADGALAVLGEGGFTVVHPGPWGALTAGPGGVLLADATGVVAWEGAPRPVGGPAGAVALAAGAEAWLATGPAGGVWVSRDAGATWEEETAGLEPQTTGSGAPRDGVYWTGLTADADLWLAAAWEGLYVRNPAESRWDQLELRTSPLVRSLQLLDDGTLLTAPYGAGLARGTPGNNDWVDAAPSLGWPWLRAVLATEGGAGPWWAIGGKHLYRSDDAGVTWGVVLAGFSLAGDVVAVAPGWPADGRAWAGGQDADGNGAVAITDDGGATWALEPLPGCGEKPTALAADADGAWIACGGGVWRVGESVDAELVPAPLAAGEILGIVADNDGFTAGGAGGLWRRGADGGWEVLFEARVRAFAAEGDGWLLATDIGLVRLVDGAVTPLGWPVDDLVESVTVGTDGVLAAGTFGGAWTSVDGGVTWALATDRDRYDDRDTTWYYEGFSEVDESRAKSGLAQRGEAGAVAEWRLAGTALQVIARGEGALRVTVDGAATEVPLAAGVSVTGGAWGPVWSAALDDGRHVVRIEVLDGWVALDGGVRWRAPGAEPPAVVVPDAPGGGGEGKTPPACGCGDGGGAALLVGLGIAVGRRARRTEGARARVRPGGPARSDAERRPADA